MARILIHCGSYKTGTSCTQNRLFASRRELLAASVLYPETGLDHRSPEVGIRHYWLAAGRRRTPKRWPAVRERLRQEIAESGARAVVLSAEAWSSQRDLVSLEELVRTLRGDGHEVEGVVYLRHRLTHARSVYRQWTRGRGNTKSFAEFVHGPYRDVGPVTVATSLRAVFGSDVAFHRLERVGRSDEHLLTALGVGPIPDVPTESRNVSPDALAVELWRRFVQAGIDPFAKRELATYVVRARALLPAELDARAARERPDRAFVENSSRLREIFRRDTRWDPAEVDALFHVPADERLAPSPDDWSAELDRAVSATLQAR